MDIHDIFKQLKTLEPDAAYVARSRESILSTKKLRISGSGFGILRIFGEVFKSASAIALTSIAIVVIFGGFSVWQLVKPGLLALDPAGLRAEAQAIDIQIQLAGVEYQESTIAEAGDVSRNKNPFALLPKKTESPADKEASSSTAPVSVEDALDALAE